VPEQFAALFFGLASALVWGAGDFCGGFGARRASVLRVLAIGQLSGLGVLLFFALLFREPVPSLAEIGWSIAAGLSGTIGLGALYRGFAVGRVSIVAPVSAVVGAALPALYGALVDGLPAPLKLFGFALALGAIVLASQAAHQAGTNTALEYGLLAGLGFGGFFIFVHQAGGEASTFFPLAVARAISIPLVAALGFARGVQFPPRAALAVIVLSGILDAGGNVFFLLASVLGRLDVATILASLYPATSVILARLVLHEKISRAQQFGVALALAAIMLIAA
jgi:drug/metabolite transporter (DMT)-like permease